MKPTTTSTRRAQSARKLTSTTPTTSTALVAIPKHLPNPLPPKVPQQLVSQVCGLTDPFCSHAGGAKYPDFSSVRTLPYTRRQRMTLTTDAAGYANLVIAPQYNYNPYSTVNVYAGNAVTSWSNFAAYPTIAGVSGYRIVSAGFIVRHVVSPLNSAGMVYIRQYGTENGSFMAPIDTTTYNCTSEANVPVQEAKEIAVVLQKTSQMPQNFYFQTTDTTTVGNVIARGVAFATVAVAGAPFSTPVLEIEFITNYELIFEDGSDLAQVATPPPPANALITDAAARVSSSLVPIVRGGVEAFGKALVARATTALATYLGGPPAAFAARSALAITVD